MIKTHMVSCACFGGACEFSCSCCTCTEEYKQRQRSEQTLTEELKAGTATAYASALDNIFVTADAPDDKIVSDGGSSGYYELPPGAVEIQDLVEYRGMNFALGNIFKAAYRLGRKAGNDELYELRKMKWYVDREINRVLKSQQESKQ